MPCFDASFPVPLIRLEETDSTSRYLTTLCEHNDVEEFTIVLSCFQTAGRGQREHSWESEAGKNLLFSLALYPSFLEVQNQFLLSQVVSLSMKEGLEEFASGFSIKWPNDIYWGKKKIGGMLIENDLTGSRIRRSIVGVGININQEKFYSFVSNPVSLTQITGNRYDLLSVLESLVRRCIYYYGLLRKGETNLVAQRYCQSLFRREGMYPYADKDGEFVAKFVRIEQIGTLVLEDQCGKQRKYAFGEVRFLKEEVVF
ncbi:Bifunctional ligase/repressor BirA [termite gut metagenome]|uniref:Bifunctional ligase/repressor BirA n=1 Tax=termite gut metagenome TaxID=433724 RepID=A0A5J4SY26_9ZZZZ